MSKSWTALLVMLALLVAACGGGQQGAGPGSAATDAASPAATQAAGQTTVRVALPTKGLLFLPFYVAQQEGFFADEGVSIEMVEAKGKNAVSVVAAGDADAVIILPELVIAPQMQGAELTMIGATVNENVFDFYTTEDIDSLRELEGQQVGIMGKSSGIEFMTRWLLDEQGAGADSSQIVSSGVPPAALAALKEGQISGRVFPPYFGVLAQQAGAKRLVSFAKFDKQYPQVIAASNGFLENKPEAARGFLAAIVKANEFIGANPDRAIDIATEAIGAERPAMAQAFKAAKDHYAMDGAIPEDGLQWVMDNMRRYGDFQDLPPIDEIYDPSYLPGR